jgi:hypothetical protein
MSRKTTISYQHRDGIGRKLFSLSISSLEELPANLSLPSPHFACLLVSDARNISNAEIMKFAGGLLDQGLCYLCAWGPDCGRVHAYVDLAIVNRRLDEGLEFPHIMTTEHRDSLDKALWFLTQLAFPDDAYADTCESSLVISISSANWDAHVRRRLANLERLITDVVGQDTENSM